MEGNQEAELSVTVFGADSQGNSTGEYWKRIKITVPPDLHKQALREGWFYALCHADVIGTAETTFY